MSDLVERAKEFAINAHNSIGHMRKYGEEQYWKHPERVANMVHKVGGSEEMEAAAWLHDTVEDTPITLEDIKSHFGLKVMQLVDELTDVSRPEDGNRATRKAKDLYHTSMASPEAKTIKLADLIDNTFSIVSLDPGFAKVYILEKENLLEVLTEGDSTLHKIASHLVEVGKLILEIGE